MYLNRSTVAFLKGKTWSVGFLNCTEYLLYSLPCSLIKVEREEKEQ